MQNRTVFSCRSACERMHARTSSCCSTIFPPHHLQQHQSNSSSTPSPRSLCFTLSQKKKKKRFIQFLLQKNTSHITHVTHRLQQRTPPQNSQKKAVRFVYECLEKPGKKRTKKKKNKQKSPTHTLVTEEEKQCAQSAWRHHGARQ